MANFYLLHMVRMNRVTTTTSQETRMVGLEHYVYLHLLCVLHVAILKLHGSQDLRFSNV